MKKLLILIFAMLLLVPTAFAAFSCDFGDLSTTCIVNSTKNVVDGEVISGTGNLIIASSGVITNTSFIANQIVDGSVIINMSGNVTIAKPSGVAIDFSRNFNGPGVNAGGDVTIIGDVVTINGSIIVDGGAMGDTGQCAGKGGNVKITANTINLLQKSLMNTDGCDNGNGHGADAGNVILFADNIIAINGTNIQGQGGRGHLTLCSGTRGRRGDGGTLNITGLNSVDIGGVANNLINFREAQFGACNDGINGTENIFHGKIFNIRQLSFRFPATIFALFPNLTASISDETPEEGDLIQVTGTCNSDLTSNSLILTSNNVVVLNETPFPQQITFVFNDTAVEGSVNYNYNCTNTFANLDFSESIALGYELIIPIPFANLASLAGMAALIFLTIGLFMKVVGKKK